MIEQSSSVSAPDRNFFLSPDRQKFGSYPKIRLHEKNVEELKEQVNFFIISYLALLRVCPVIYIPLLC